MFGYRTGGFLGISDRLELVDDLVDVGSVGVGD